MRIYPGVSCGFILAFPWSTLVLPWSTLGCQAAAGSLQDARCQV